MSVIKVNCPICRGTKRVDKVGGLHSKECPCCKGLGKIDKNPIENVAEVAIVAVKPEQVEEHRVEPTIKPKEGSLNNGKGKQSKG